MKSVDGLRRTAADVSCRCCGFTLIELLLAIGIGMVLVYAATASVRAASQTVTVAQRLSIENALLRGGIEKARDELDYWTMEDDPLGLPAPAAQFLRPITAPNLGITFTPLTAPLVLGASRELDTGWDAKDPWAVHDPRCWNRINPVELDISDDRFGRYGIFANADAPTPVFATVNTKTYSVTSVPHPWLFQQMRTLKNTLGYYGWCEYMPANAYYSLYTSYSSTLTGVGGIPKELIVPDLGQFICANDIIHGYSCGLLRVTQSSYFAVPTVSKAYNAATLQADARTYYRNGITDDAGDVTAYMDFLSRTVTVQPLLAATPATWPSVNVSVNRFANLARFQAVMRISWASPLTGYHGELSFTSYSTTLRGARQQRKPTSGWANWDNRLNAQTTYNEATLDSPSPPP